MDMNLRLLPTLSEIAPATRVAIVAITPLSCTIRVIAPRSLATVSNTKRLKYIFSTLHASCPTRPNSIRIIQLFFPNVCFSIFYLALRLVVLVVKVTENFIEHILRLVVKEIIRLLDLIKQSLVNLEDRINHGVVRNQLKRLLTVLSRLY